MAVAGLSADQRRFQRAMLDGVSRTFALNVPELIAPLSDVVANGYLLCRIADTIEDAPALSCEEKRLWLERYIEVVEGRACAGDFARGLVQRLDRLITEPERQLVAETATVLAITAGFAPDYRAPLVRCVRIMSVGMADFAETASAGGFDTIAGFDRYCYVVAGVVGEMLASLFALEVPALRDAPQSWFDQARVFGRALQTTNVLKDIHDDARRGVSWLPRDLGRDRNQSAAQGERIRLLAARAQHDLRAALAFTLHIPGARVDMRRFCLMPMALALVTLARLRVCPDFADSGEIKVTRNELGGLIRMVQATASDDTRIREGFEQLLVAAAH